jgi:hypothetical protein
MQLTRSQRAVSEPLPRRRHGAPHAGAWLSALVALVGSLAAGPSAAESAAAPALAPPAEAVLVGSSSFNQPFGQIIERELEQRGYRVTRKGVDGAGLARPDYRDMNQVLEALPIGHGTAVVFVYLGVNDAQDVWLYPEERAGAGLASVPFGAADWDTVYGRRARGFLERICERGARRAVVLLPVDVNLPELQHRLERIRELQAQAAAATSCAVAIRTNGDQGRFEADGLATRLPDGFHMSERGAQIVWKRIAGQVLALLEPGAR